MNKLFLLTLLILTGFAAKTHCMELQEQPTHEPQPTQEQSAVSTLKQLASKKVANALIQPGNLEAFIENSAFIQGLGINEEISNAIATQIMQNTTIPENLINVLIQKRKLQNQTEIYANATAISYDSKWIAFNSRQIIYLYRQTHEGWQLVSTLDNHDNNIKALAFSPDNQLLASASVDSTVCLYRLTGTGAQLVTTLTDFDDNDEATTVAFSPDSKLLASGSDNGTMNLYRLTDTEPQLIIVYEGHRAAICNLAFSRDNKWLVSASWDGTICLYKRTNEGIQFHETKDFENREGLSSMAISPDSRWIAAAANDNRIYISQLTDEGIQETTCLQSQIKDIDDYRVTFSSDSKWLAYTFEKTVCLCNLADETKPVTTLQDHTGNVIGVAFSPDNQLLASAACDGIIFLYRLTNKGAQRVTALQNHGNVRSVIFSPDNKWLTSTDTDKIVRLYNLKALHEFTYFIENNLLLEHALLLHACLKNKISLQEDSHLFAYFKQFSEAVQRALIEQVYIIDPATNQEQEFVEAANILLEISKSVPARPHKKRKTTHKGINE